METAKFIELLAYTIPAIITGVIAYFFFKEHTKNEHSRRGYELMKAKQSQALPTQLQAYERMTLFLERIAPAKLLVRVRPSSDDKIAYQKKLINAIETEFEHNLAQQIYLTSDCWNAIITSKNNTMNLIRAAAANTAVPTASALQEHILKDLMEKPAPSIAGLAFLKNEAHKIF